MGISDSPLADRVIFVEGAPRSGTTMLVSFVAVHAEVAGTTAESNMFDRGIGALFDNYELTGHHETYLAGFLTREELVDLGREIGDRILLAMREKMKPEAGWVVEKTPAPLRDPAVTMARKAACYPDARYLHIVRDEAAVARSLVRTPFHRGGERAGLKRAREAVAAIRGALGDAEHYRELEYERVAAEPREAMKEVFEWLGLDCDAPTLTEVETLSRERFSRFASRRAADSDAPARRGALARRVRRLTRRRPFRSRRGPGEGVERSGASARESAIELVDALREGNLERLEELIDSEFSFELRSGAGARSADGEEGLAAMVEVGEAMLDRRFRAESWFTVCEEGIVSLVVTATRGAGERVDAHLAVLTSGGRIRRVHVISAGDPAGERLRPWPGLGSAD